MERVPIRWCRTRPSSSSDGCAVPMRISRNTWRASAETISVPSRSASVIATRVLPTAVGPATTISVMSCVTPGQKYDLHGTPKKLTISLNFAPFVMERHDKIHHYFSLEAGGYCCGVGLHPSL